MRMEFSPQYVMKEREKLEDKALRRTEHSRGSLLQLNARLITGVCRAKMAIFFIHPC
jgi:hypothetical protein